MQTQEDDACRKKWSARGSDSRTRSADHAAEGSRWKDGETLSTTLCRNPEHRGQMASPDEEIGLEHVF